MQAYKFRSVRRARTQEYERYETVAIDDATFAKSSWLRSALAMFQDYRMRVDSSSSVSQVQTAIDVLLLNSQALHLMNLPVSQLTEQKLELLFKYLESEISKFHKGRSAARISQQFRAFILASLPLMQTRISRVNLRFKTQLSWTGSSRSLISDLPSHPREEQSRVPIGITTGTNYQDTRAAHTRILEADLNAVRAGANADLAYFKKARDQVRDLVTQKTDPAIYDFILTTCKDSRLSKLQRLSMHDLVASKAVDLLSASAKIINERRHHGVQRPYFSRLEDAMESAFHGFESKYEIRPYHLLSLPHRACTMELLSAFVLILTYTGWNSNSLCHMPIRGIKEDDEGNIRIQGYKGKTDDDTPVYMCQKKHADLYYALRLIMWNHSSLKQLGFIRQDEERVWFSWSVRAGILENQTMAFQNFLEKFSDRHKLPKFSFDQIRTQVLALTYAKSGSHELTRHMAGHANLYSLGFYINQLLSLRLASASNYEFSKRLESGIYFNLSNEADLAIAKSSPKRMPIGDGSTCSNPWSPPAEAMLHGEVCSAESCHVGEGCKNRELLMTPERMEELVRKRFYYRRNWQRLLSDNPDKFKLTVFASFMFVERLCIFIESGPYKNIIESLVNKVKREFDEGDTFEKK